MSNDLLFVHAQERHRDVRIHSVLRFITGVAGGRRTSEQTPTLMQLQLAPKQFKADDSRSRSQRGRTYGKCSKVHDGSCVSSSGCHKCGRQGPL